MSTRVSSEVVSKADASLEKMMHNHKCDAVTASEILRRIADNPCFAELIALLVMDIRRITSRTEKIKGITTNKSGVTSSKL